MDWKPDTNKGCFPGGGRQPCALLDLMQEKGVTLMYAPPWAGKTVMCVLIEQQGNYNRYIRRSTGKIPEIDFSHPESYFQMRPYPSYADLSQSMWLMLRYWPLPDNSYVYSIWKGILCKPGKCQTRQFKAHIQQSLWGSCRDRLQWGPSNPSISPSAGTRGRCYIRTFFLVTKALYSKDLTRETIAAIAVMSHWKFSLLFNGPYEVPKILVFR